jgi:glutamate-1-semialdehyde 2,1-aminomutase
VRSEGCHVWDGWQRIYRVWDGLRSVALGHGFKPVVEAAYQQMQQGINFTRPAPIEVECGEKLASLIDSAEMVKFGKNGSDVTSAAIKLARAYTGRDIIGICAEHPFFSVDDWFIGSTEMPAGIPNPPDATAIFHYNDIDSIKALFEKYLADTCLIMEAERMKPPSVTSK